MKFQKKKKKKFQYMEEFTLDYGVNRRWFRNSNWLHNVLNVNWMLIRCSNFQDQKNFWDPLMYGKILYSVKDIN